MTRRQPRVAYSVVLTFAVVSCFLGVEANAQEINFGAVQVKQPHVVYAGVGAENAAVADVGYSHLLRWMDRTVVITTDLRLMVLDPSDFRLRIGGVLQAASYGPWMIAVKVRPMVRGATSEVSRMTNVGVDAGFSGGYFGQHWFVAADLDIDWAAATYLKHSARYRRLVYAGAKDGWYSSTGASFSYGLFGGYSFTNVDIVLRAGQTRDIQFNMLTLPFYLTISVYVRLPLVAD